LVPVLLPPHKITTKSRLATMVELFFFSGTRRSYGKTDKLRIIL
jgi:hypothetical protein